MYEGPGRTSLPKEISNPTPGPPSLINQRRQGHVKCHELNLIQFSLSSIQLGFTLTKQQVLSRKILLYARNVKLPHSPAERGISETIIHGSGNSTKKMREAQLQT